MEPNYVYRCKVLRVVDGDTLDVDLDLGFSVRLLSRVRLMGIDTPESRTRNLHEKKLGLAAKARLKELISEAMPLPGKRGRKDIAIKTAKVGRGKFGRILASLLVNGLDCNEILINEDHARRYFGGSKGEFGPWTKVECGQVYRWTSQGYEEVR